MRTVLAPRPGPAPSASARRRPERRIRGWRAAHRRSGSRPPSPAGHGRESQDPQPPPGALPGFRPDPRGTPPRATTASCAHPGAPSRGHRQSGRATPCAARSRSRRRSAPPGSLRSAPGTGSVMRGLWKPDSGPPHTTMPTSEISRTKPVRLVPIPIDPHRTCAGSVLAWTPSARASHRSDWRPARSG